MVWNLFSSLIRPLRRLISVSPMASESTGQETLLSNTVSFFGVSKANFESVADPVANSSALRDRIECRSIFAKLGVSADSMVCNSLTKMPSIRGGVCASEIAYRPIMGFQSATRSVSDSRRSSIENPSPYFSGTPNCLVEKQESNERLMLAQSRGLVSFDRNKLKLAVTTVPAAWMCHLLGQGSTDTRTGRILWWFSSPRHRGPFSWINHCC